MFRNASQRDDKTIEQVITRFRQKAETCEFTEVEEHIRDQIIEKRSSIVLRQKCLEKGKELNLEMLREVAGLYETAAAQIENFAKPEEVKQEERENVNRLLKQSSVGRFATSNKPKSYSQEKCFVEEKLIIEQKILIVRQETVNVLNAIKRDIMRDAEIKEKGKMYADVKRNTVNNDLKVGDKVLLKQNESNKISTVCRKDPFIITERKGNCVTVQNDDVCLKQNILHVEKCNP